MEFLSGGTDIGEFSPGGLLLRDNMHLRVGTGGDLRLYHDGSSSNYISNRVGNLYIESKSGQTAIQIIPDGATDLRYSGTKKFETTSSGTHSSGFTHTFGASGAIPTLKAGGSNTDIALEAVGAGGWVELKTTGTARWRVKGTDGHFYPVVNNTYDIGTSSERVRNIYTNDLHLSNEGHSNDVDGTWGDYTIQEGESDLFLINNRSGKKFKFMLQEVS